MDILHALMGGHDAMETPKDPFPAVGSVCVHTVIAVCDVPLCQVTFPTDAGWDQSAPARVCVIQAVISPFV